MFVSSQFAFCADPQFVVPGVRLQEATADADVFARMDANGDGVVTADDATTDSRGELITQLLQSADADGDGQVTREEYLAKRRLGFRDDATFSEPSPVAAAFLYLLDIDRDGGLSSAELAIAAERLRTMDADADGAVSPEELRGFGEMALHELANEDRSARAIATLFSQFDANSDGEISQAEAPPRMQQAFGGLDLDGDGAISRDEFDHALRRVGRNDADQDRR